MELGNTYTSKAVVSEEMTALSMGSGDLPVLATPAMIALMENAAKLAVAPQLAAADTTVGGYMECSHLAPTPVGVEVEATATLVKIEGKALHFDIAAYSGDKKLGEGHHIRYIVDRARFLSRL